MKINATGTCPGVILGGVRETNEALVYKGLCQTIEEWLAIQEEDGEPFPKGTANGSYAGTSVVSGGNRFLPSCSSIQSNTPNRP